MKNAKSNWDEALKSTSAGAYEEFPDGVYIVQLSSMEIGESKAGKVQVKSGFTFVEGEYTGKTKNDFIGLEGARGLEPLQWRLSSLGVKVEDVDFQRIQDTFDELVEARMTMRIQLKTTKSSSGTEFQNIRIQKLLPGYDPDESGYDSTESIPEEEPVEEGQELKIGMTVAFSVDGASAEGQVKKIDEKKGTADVKVGLETRTIQITDISSIVDDGKDG